MNVFNQGTIDPLILVKDCFLELSMIKPFNWKALPSVRLSRNLLFSVSIYRWNLKFVYRVMYNPQFPFERIVSATIK